MRENARLFKNTTCSCFTGDPRRSVLATLECIPIEPRKERVAFDLLHAVRPRPRARRGIGVHQRVEEEARLARHLSVELGEVAPAHALGNLCRRTTTLLCR